ncbi:hypothetical protein, partial [Pseudomonas gessardii]|uniref:hypothetical protein n=1 Tax=Pseudomonas gessardii TaxID=78544 RepID=UPI001FEF3606
HKSLAGRFPTGRLIEATAKPCSLFTCSHRKWSATPEPLLVVGHILCACWKATLAVTVVLAGLSMDLKEVEMNHGN